MRLQLLHLRCWLLCLGWLMLGMFVGFAGNLEEHWWFLCSTNVEVAKGNLLQVCMYDVMITYNKYYQTLWVWLIGYDEVGLYPSFSTLAQPKQQNCTPLTSSQIFQDISADHAQKIVTIEPFIHSASLQAASVHPCKHASVMKKVIERMKNSVIEEQLAQRGKPSSSSTGKDTPKKEKKWPFSWQSSGSAKDVQLQAGAEEEEVEGMRVDFIWSFSSSLLWALCRLLRLTQLRLFELMPPPQFLPHC